LIIVPIQNKTDINMTNFMCKYFTTRLIFSLLIFLVIFSKLAFAQRDGVSTYTNPVLPGSHPDQTLLKVGNDYYTAGSSFHWAPNLPIYHSTDLVHWKIISTVVSPDWSVIRANADPKDGTWQGALAHFAGKYWAFFFIHGAGQYFCTAPSMEGPWTSPTLVQGSIGYDNAVFVDDNDKAYMLMKNGQDFAAIQEIDANGRLVGTRMDMNWVNRDHIYSWAEGPKMVKRNGRYYYFVAGHVYGGQYVLSSPTLTANESSWTRHGNFFKGSSSGAFTGPNHITSPVQIADGTWWCLAHSYGNNGWEGQGRQSMLFQVFWDANGVPYANNPNGQPLTAPNLPSNGVNYEVIESDNFSSITRKPEWYFHHVTNISKSSLTARPGFLRLTPGSGITHILQRDAVRQYTLVTKVEINATANGQQAGLRIMNGEDKVFASVYSGFNNGKKIGISFNGTNTTEVNNTIGNTVWLKLVRNQHTMTGFYSADGKAWTQIGGNVSLIDLDKAQTNDNAWVGNSIALFAKSQTADFDQFSFNHGFDPLSVASYYNYNGTTISNGTVTNSTEGGWCMLPGVTMESDGASANQIVVSAASGSSNGSLEVWIDNIGSAGKKIATIPISQTGGTTTFKDFSANVSVTGQHDLYMKFVGGTGVFRLNTVRFVSSDIKVAFISPESSTIFSTLDTITLTATASTNNGSITDVKFYNGTTLLHTDNSAPYSYSWTNASVGTHTIRAVATDNQGKTAETSISIRVNVPQGPYNGTWHAIPGTIQLENYDVGGNGIAYMDDSPGSSVTPTVNFRTDEDVDIENCTDVGGGYNIGFATAGEWLEYSVDVEKPGTYDLDLRVAADGTGRTVSVSMDGVNIASNVAISNTGGWQTWQTTTVKNIDLQAGKQILRVTIGATDYVNLNYVTFKLIKERKQEPFHGTAHTIPGRIQAEDYDLGGEGLAFHEANAEANEGGADYRTDEVDIEETQDIDGAYNIAYIMKGEWLEYTVNVTSDGIYDLDLRMAADGANKTLHIEMDGKDVSGAINVPNTGGWQTWQTVTVKGINLTAGEHVMRIAFDSDYMNLNYFEFRDVITGVNEMANSSIKIFPNPFKNTMTVSAKGDFNYQIINNQGLLLESGLGNNQVIIGNGLQSGTYILKITIQGEEDYMKFVKY
jgi:beta-xylosidase